MLINAPGFTGKITLNVFVLLILITVYFPLNPRFSSPVGLIVLLIFWISISESRDNPWGNSVINVAIPPSQIENAINLKPFNSYGFVLEICDVLSILKYFWISVLLVGIVSFDSWMIYPSIGGLADIGASFGST